MAPASEEHGTPRSNCCSISAPAMGSGLSATVPAPVAKGFARGPEGLPTSGRADILTGFAAQAGCTAHAEHGPQHRQLPPALPAPVLEDAWAHTSHRITE